MRRPTSLFALLPHHPTSNIYLRVFLGLPPATHAPLRRTLATTAPRSSPAQARIYDPIRDPDAFSTALLLATSSNTPLITLWTASWCGTCKTVAPRVLQAVQEVAASLGDLNGGDSGGGRAGSGGSSGSDTSSGGAFNVGYAEVELDSPTIGDVPSRYLIASIPTLLAFRRGEAQMAERLQGAALLGDEAAVKKWIEEVVRGGGGGGAGLLSGVMGLFGGR